ncbi:MAG: Ig-like domain-containing protein, partial [Planctomycetota bacterium]
GDDQVSLTEVIRLRFSQPLDPRTAADPLNYQVEIISVPAPHPVVPVSVFVAQQRLGRVEVALTPINPLPSDSTIRVSISEGVEDMIGQSINPTIISFSTGVGTSPFSGDVLEEFSDNFLEDTTITTANWNGSKPYVDSTPGELKAAFAPYAGDGSDGAFSAPIGQTTTLQTGTTTQRLYNYTSFDIPIGATVVAQGNFPLVIHCQDDVDIAGTLALDGLPGGLGLDGQNGSTTATGGAGGLAGPGGGDGGDGAYATVGGGGNYDGQDGVGTGAGLGGFSAEDQGNNVRTTADNDDQVCSGPPLSFEECRNREGGGGGGFFADGGDADNNGGSGLARNGSLFANGGNGGLSWGDGSLSFASTSVTVDVFDTNLGAEKTISLVGIPTLTALQGGSGGGGGGGEDDQDINNGSVWATSDGSDDGGGGGGGGGGALQIVAFGDIDVTGTIRCNGGDGGNSAIDVAETDFGSGAGGGGGSGGTIWLQCRGAATLGSLSVIEAVGGTGGLGYAQSTNVALQAGNGADGRIRVEDSDGVVNNAPAGSAAGVFAPALDLASEAWSQWQNTGIFTPNYEAPDVTADVFANLTFNGTIKIYMEGAPENLLDLMDGAPNEALIDDPDLSASTGLVLVYDSTAGGLQGGDPWDILDNNKWWRFKVEFTVDAFHLFTDPMPTVQSIRFNITETQ